MFQDLPQGVRILLQNKGWTAVIVLSLAIGIGANTLVQSLLFGLAATDPLTISAAVFLLAGVSALAGYLPARTVSRVDPLVALRYE